MQIDLPSGQEQRLAQQATANGFASLEAYASSLLGLYATLPVDPADEAAMQ